MTKLFLIEETFRHTTFTSLKENAMHFGIVLNSLLIYSTMIDLRFFNMYFLLKADELRDLQMDTGSTMSSFTEQGMINGSVGSTGVYNLDPYVTARYVLLQMQAPDLSTLQLCEVQVFGVCKPSKFTNFS